ncbi:MAG: hypothetical protein AAFO74_12760 [Pseudomonadota bacterium]
MQRRLKSLEDKTGMGKQIPDSIILHFVSPGPDGPIDSGRGSATILAGTNKGLQFYRKRDETVEAFEARVAALVN